MSKGKTDFGLNWLIRNARGLDPLEKLFLFTVASHQDGMYKTHDKNIDDMGVGRATYYRHRKSLIEKGILSETRRMNAPTVFVIHKASLEAWTESHTETVQSQIATPQSHAETPQSHAETPQSQPETPESRSDNTKGNIKGNKKGNNKGNEKDSIRDVASADAEAPVSSTDVPGSSVPLAESLSFSRIVSGPIERGMPRIRVNNKAESHSETELPGGVGATEDRAAELKRQYGVYRPDLTDEELNEMVARVLDREELRRINDQAHERHQEAREVGEKEPAW